MSKLITVYIDGKPSYNLDVKENTTIEQLKKSIKDFDKYDSTFYSNKNSKVNVLNTDKYDKFSLSSIWPSMKNSKIELISLPDLNSLSSNQTKNKLTGDKNVDKIILMNLSDKDLGNMCKVNNYTRSLCQDDNFWMNRTLNRFGEVVGENTLNNVKQKYYKSWRDYYIYLVDFLEKLYKQKGMKYIDIGNALVLDKRADMIKIVKEMEINSNKLIKFLKENNFEEAEKLLKSDFVNPNILFDYNRDINIAKYKNLVDIISFLINDQRFKPKFVLYFYPELGKRFKEIMTIISPRLNAKEIIYAIIYHLDNGEYFTKEDALILTQEAVKKGADETNMSYFFDKFDWNSSPANSPTFNRARPSPLGSSTFNRAPPSPLGSPTFNRVSPSPLGSPTFNRAPPSPLGSPTFEVRKTNKLSDKIDNVPEGKVLDVTYLKSDGTGGKIIRAPTRSAVTLFLLDKRMVANINRGLDGVKNASEQLNNPEILKDFNKRRNI